LDWQPLSNGVWECQDYRIAAEKTSNGGWSYCAFAPPLSEIEFEARLKTHYALGEYVPQRRAPLGCFPDAQAARQACADHLAESVSPPVGG